MGLFNSDGQRARQELADMYQRRPLLATYRAEWQRVYDLLANHYTRGLAEMDSTIARVRAQCLEMPEPRPLREEFLPPNPPSSFQSVQAREEVERRFEREWHAYVSRESWRLRELQIAQDVCARHAAKELRQRIERNRALWPSDADISDILLAADDIAFQVDLQNEKVEDSLSELNDLLRVGLSRNPSEAASAAASIGNEPKPDEITRSVEIALAMMEVPSGVEPAAKVGYSPESRQIVVEYELPREGIVPKHKSYKWVKNKNVVQATPRPAGQVKAFYANSIAQLSLLCLHVIFSANRAFDVAVFNGVVDTLDPRTGKPVRPCLISVRVTRETFDALDLVNVDPAACLKHLNAGVSRSPTELAPVRPVVEFSMVDPRFIAETDAMSGMDSRPNLMDLTPGEFEALIQNLFTKMGLEARQTRASRDGGVDCVAYDTRPIFGGKVVIQAKRYKNTVGVSAVRDLFGTLQNEGASKGILVTTSGYGTASFDFAQNKPIELIDGANLLYLLEQHAGLIARIEPPDDWRDPTSDTPASV
ncbi:restriction endonuclease [Mycolicibacterium rhodesiae]|uniref:Restriction endonuclease type IV Mrr domain-containing protein n=1 Tax=Mycolicibacterium rhodesiae TaxID=36814 RepID=A0A1X0IX78_MYCRH|nr:restriction endonuclease [Mycolicibacterium rhodesiae]MCV7343081.1 restriction endonuclease [Mycolicibacterium rhodesiae]ORB53002.1 hypothetical protein BST42_13305 [Mycolicibacterium rhodesiae]